MYVDRSEDEFSLHQLDQVDAELIYEAVIDYINKIPNPPEKHREVKIKLINIKKELENELPNY